MKEAEVGWVQTFDEDDQLCWWNPRTGVQFQHSSSSSSSRGGNRKEEEEEEENEMLLQLA